AVSELRVRAIRVASEWCHDCSSARLDSGVQDFRRLRVWQRAHEFSHRVEMLVLGMPYRDPAGRKGQLARAADSIPSNIAEGCGAASQRDFARFLDAAIKSSTETERQLLAVYKRGWLTKT